MLLLICAITSSLYVVDYGVHGTVFPIEEEHFIKHLQSQERLLKIPKWHPEPIRGLREAKQAETHYFDPTLTLKADIHDHEGTLLLAKGTSYNPLEHVALSRPLIFFNGDNPHHIQWAKSLEEATWILVQGTPILLEEQEVRPIYFDQHGLLTTKLSIQSIPAKVSQEGKRLKIETVPIEVR